MLPEARTLLSPIMVGRTWVVDEVRRAIGAARRGEGNTLLISGDAGIGKSRLVLEARRHALHSGFLVLQGSCFPNDHGCPFAPILDLLRSALPQLSAADRDFLSQERFALLPELTLSTVAVPSHDHPELEKRRLFAVFVQFLARLAHRQPLLCIFEDLHWSDDVSLELLHFVARQVADLPLLLIGAYRSEEVQPALANLLAQLDRERLAREIRLAPLSRAEVDIMLSAIFESTKPLRVEFVESVHALTEGNPFFIEEVLNTMHKTGQRFEHDAPSLAANATVDVPRSVQAAVQRRYETLQAEDCRVVLTAAVIGRQFDVDLLQRLTGLEDATLIGSLRALMGAQLIVEQSPDRFAFRHALTRQAIYARLLARERRDLHRQIAYVLEAAAGETNGALVADLAHHFYVAEEWHKVAQYAAEAARQALNLFSLRAAVEHLSHALEAASSLQIAPSPWLLLERGRATSLLGEFDGSRADLEQALQSARTLGDRQHAWEALLEMGFLWSSRQYEQAGFYFQQALALAEEMQDPRSIARSLNRMGNWYANAEQPHRARELHLEARALFATIDDMEGLVDSEDLLGMANLLAADLYAAKRHADVAAEYYRSTNNPSGLVKSLTMIAFVGATQLTDHNATPPIAPSVARASALYGIEIAHKNGLRNDGAYVLATTGILLGGQGRFQEAFTAFDAAYSIAEEISHLQWQLLTHFGRGIVMNDLLAHAAARVHLQAALDLAEHTSARFWKSVSGAALASTCVQLGDLDRASGLLQGAGLSEPPDSGASRMWWKARTQAALARGDFAMALDAAETLQASAANRELAEEGVIPRVTLLRGRALLGLDRLDEAEDEASRLIRWTRAREALPLLWRALELAGQVARKRKQEKAAASSFAEARELALALSEPIADESLRGVAQRAIDNRLPAPRPPTPLQQARARYNGLTVRELDVLRLLADGLTNPQIAQRLIVSAGTVKTHTLSIYRKLDVNNRTQAIRRARDLGLLV